MNTDAIDNSGGVDCSDHEVNIKVLLNEAVAAGDMTGKQRNRLLEEMTGEVAELVLRNNYLQSQALSVAASQASSMLEVHVRLIRGWSATGSSTARSSSCRAPRNWPSGWRRRGSFSRRSLPC